ncbi:MAG: hypothetical protein AAF658_05875 [Myxococcota bacterium]
MSPWGSIKNHARIGCALLCVSCTEAEPVRAPPAPPRIDWSSVTQDVTTDVLARARNGRLARADGYTYTVDIAQLMSAAARLGDPALYDALLPHAQAARVDANKNPYVRGFVAWRVHPEQPRDATGTTEALRLAEAFWLGASRFDREEHRTIALELVDGYRRHGYVDQGVWLIRNYYNLQTDAFATNSFLVDYDADFLRALGDQFPELRALATRVDTLIAAAITPTGLVHELVQPEIATAMPYLGSAVFSPNNRAQLSNSCTVLERALVTHREDARRLFDFAHAQADSLRLIYDVSTGEPHPHGYAGVETYGCLTRLAHALEIPDRARVFEPKLDWFVRDYLKGNAKPASFIASELLLTAAAVLESHD